ncbi:hypothetical protein FACS1894141_6900 [Spirochaetia bacterium]|nr:hypothetical protein FACS1894141_6900 [Spirochaetia bacterium]
MVIIISNSRIKSKSRNAGKQSDKSINNVYLTKNIGREVFCNNWNDKDREKLYYYFAQSIFYRISQ